MKLAILLPLTGAALLSGPTEAARANIACEVATGPEGAITEGIGALTGGAIGGGNPAGEACSDVTGAISGAITAPVTGAIKDLGNSVFNQLTTWVAQGAGWLMGQVVEAIDSSTTPKLETKGFLKEYGRRAAIAAILAAAMLLLAVLEGIAQGSPGLLARVALVNVPLAFIGTSVAYAVVQLLISCTDGLSAAVASASHHDSTRFFEAAIGDLHHIGGEVGKQAGIVAGQAGSEGVASETAGSFEVPLFVGFLAAIVGAFAAFFVWLELLMRDAAVYAVALFMPLALAAYIWPRWSGALRRTAELLVCVIGSKFVIVAIVSLAASLVAEESSSVEHVLAAAALMCLACFAPFVLLRLIPFSEGALAAAYGRRSAAGGAMSGVQLASDVQILRNMGRGGGGGSGVTLWSAAEGGGAGKGGGHGPGSGGSPAGGLGGGSGSGGGSGAGGKAGSSSAAGSSAAGGAAAGPAAAAAQVPVMAAQGAKQAGERLGSTGVAQAAGASRGGEEGASSSGGKDPISRPSAEQGGDGSEQSAAGPRPGGGQSTPRPPSESPASTPPGKGGEA
jgi:hypothetical protein